MSSTTEDLLLHAGMMKAVCYGPCAPRKQTLRQMAFPPDVVGCPCSVLREAGVSQLL